VAAGGPATNAAVTFAALGGEAVLVTALGHGAAADVVRADLRSCRVRVIDAAAEQADLVPISSIVVTASGRRSVVSVDASVASPAEAPDLAPHLERADVVLVDGHHPALARAAAASGAALVLDAGRWRPVLADLLPHAAIVICSADLRFPGTDDGAGSAAAMRTAGVPAVVVTNGAQPVSWWQGDRTGSVAPRPIRAVDTAGAGDVFHGAF
jgi:sugar/nucleoside kinase (ribokinase family)